MIDFVVLPLAFDQKLPLDRPFMECLKWGLAIRSAVFRHGRGLQHGQVVAGGRSLMHAIVRQNASWIEPS